MKHIESKRERRRLDNLDVKILEATGTYGPRNIAQIASKLGIHEETVRSRIKSIRINFPLSFQGKVYHTYLGLRKAVVFIDAIPGYEDLLFECLKANEYWLYSSPSYSSPETRVVFYGVPKDHATELEEFLQEIVNLGVAQNTRVVWTTCFRTINLTCNWFDSQSQRWLFPWDQWTEEIKTEETKLPFTLVESEDYPQKADYIDVIILKELEKNAAVKFTDLAKMLDVSPQAVKYHFDNHVIKEGLLESWQTYIPHFDAETADRCWFKFDFGDYEKFARFASSLLDKPFVTTLGKVYKQNALLAQTYIPRPELREFTRRLSKLVRDGVLNKFYYVIEDFARAHAETIPYQSFKDGSWIYDHKNHMEKLRKLVKEKMAKAC